MPLAQRTLLAALLRFAGRLRFPTLFFVTAGLFVFDVFVPDALPFADEILLGLGALVLARWRRPEEAEETPADPVEAARVVSPDGGA
ncbi:MAG: DUF6116 family protein [Myxococcota bacterium]